MIFLSELFAFELYLSVVELVAILKRKSDLNFMKLSIYGTCLNFINAYLHHKRDVMPYFEFG